MFPTNGLFFSKWSRVMMLKLSEDVGLRDDGLNGCHLEPSMHAPRAQLVFTSNESSCASTCFVKSHG